MNQSKVSKFAVLTFFLLSSLMIAACGGGGSTASAPSTTVGGVASKGLIKGGTVNVYAVKTDGTQGSLLGTTTTSSTDGSYEVKNLAYNGSIIVTVTGGTYTDEATGATNVPNPGLSAALPSAAGSVKVAVTPLTDVAFKQMNAASGGFTSANISNYNALVSTAFGVDIIGTQPIDATNAVQVAGAQSAAINYSVALAAISQMVSNGDATSVIDAIQQIQTDLSATTPQLTSTGAALTAAIAVLTDATAPILATSITADTISVDGTIEVFTATTVNPPSNATGVAQAKALIQDLRNTALSVIDYNTGDVTAVINTPFNTTAQELETVVAPELTGVTELLGWVASSASSIQTLAAGSTYTFTDLYNHPGETLTIITGSTGYSAAVKIVNTSTATLLEGTMSVSDITAPTSGSLILTTLKTTSGNATVTVSFSGTRSGDIYTGMTLKGNITTPVAIFDFSDDSKSQKMTASFATRPDGSASSVMLTGAYFKGVASTATARITGTIDVPTLVWNQNISPDAGAVAIPNGATISGKIEALSSGAVTLTINGALTGTFTNAATYNPNLADSTTNFPTWSGTFNGSIVATSGLNISVLLKANAPEYQKVNFEANYTRTLADATTIFLNCTGTYNEQTKIMTANMTNQNGLKVLLSYNGTLSSDSKFTGTITTSGNEALATFSTLSGIPRVVYADNYFETLI